MSLVLKKVVDGVAQFWDGSAWTPDKDKAKTYESRDDIMNMESDRLKDLNYRWQVFVFEDFCSNYHDGLAFAIARDEDEAKELITAQFRKAYSKNDGEPYDWGKMSVRPIEAMAAFVTGGY